MGGWGSGGFKQQGRVGHATRTGSASANLSPWPVARRGSAVSESATSGAPGPGRPCSGFKTTRARRERCRPGAGRPRLGRASAHPGRGPPPSQRATAAFGRTGPAGADGPKSGPGQMQCRIGRLGPHRDTPSRRAHPPSPPPTSACRPAAAARGLGQEDGVGSAWRRRFLPKDCPAGTASCDSLGMAGVSRILTQKIRRGRQATTPAAPFSGWARQSNGGHGL